MHVKVSIPIIRRNGTPVQDTDLELDVYSNDVVVHIKDNGIKSVVEEFVVSKDELVKFAYILNA